MEILDVLANLATIGGGVAAAAFGLARIIKSLKRPPDHKAK